MTRTRTRFLLPCLLLLLGGLGGLLLLAPAAHAQSYTLTTLVQFNNTNGANPRGGLTLYGTTSGGGTSKTATLTVTP